MKKHAITYVLVFLIIGVIQYGLQFLYTNYNHIDLPFSLIGLNVFFVLFSLLVCIALEALVDFEEMQTKIGFVYLGTLALKMVLFAAIFYKSIFETELQINQRLMVLSPMLIFLILEVYFVSKILNRKAN